VFAVIDTLSAKIAASRNLQRDKGLVLQRAIAHSVVQNYADAINDLTAYIQTDSTSSLAYWQRAVCQVRLNEYDASLGKDVRMKTVSAMTDLEQAIAKCERNAYLYYDRGNLHAINGDYELAVADYTTALSLDPRLAEAYYNRGIAYMNMKKTGEGIRDLSKAGELGLFDAYSMIKRFSKK